MGVCFELFWTLLGWLGANVWLLTGWAGGPTLPKCNQQQSVTNTVTNRKNSDCHRLPITGNR
jgi:hypothetical protein